ncbi:hypothetical protein Sden_3130 [Shewanella denitrificans OS217]|jgi:hypothetical protein|uniref:Uncharacterized protein n=1 Tax=Shewanella denitrificans (strain OS217 / ATCC BAA-1090 / DSM 15013) TaxID=318161 RepID=Q12JG9_SHEDO|nr:hypothetical protein [Shewanella denitrificans]ABE56407.1 hypothetical protein Sden_3130 [Shewanella denitrificans OS217]
MHAEIDTTKKLIEAINKGEPFSEQTVFECMRQLKRSVGFEETPENTKMWATYYWSKYQLIGIEKLICISQDDDLLRNTLYRYFGK